MTVSSASGLLALLDEPSDTLKGYALTNLDRVVHEFWFQISASIASVEALYEDEEFGQRELAAIVASKVRACMQLFRRSVRARGGGGAWQARPPFTRAACVVLHACPGACMPRGANAHPNMQQVFYHLGELDDALTYALGAGSLFDVNDQSEYTQTLIGEEEEEEGREERALFSSPCTHARTHTRVHTPARMHGVYRARPHTCRERSCTPCTRACNPMHACTCLHSHEWPQLLQAVAPFTRTRPCPQPSPQPGAWTSTLSCA